MYPREHRSRDRVNRHERNDEVLDAGTGSGIAAIYFGGITAHVKTYEVRPDFSALAQKNIKEAKLDNVDVVAADVLSAEGIYDVIHLDLPDRKMGTWAFAFRPPKGGGIHGLLYAVSWSRWQSWSMPHRSGSPKSTPTS